MDDTYTSSLFRQSTSAHCGSTASTSAVTAETGQRSASEQLFAQTALTALPAFVAELADSDSLQG